MKRFFECLFLVLSLAVFPTHVKAQDAFTTTRCTILSAMVHLLSDFVW
jgi:hypothetical protein